jgi:hypothetical protein
MKANGAIRLVNPRLINSINVVNAVTMWKWIASSLCFKFLFHYHKSTTYFANAQQKQIFPTIKTHICNIRRKCFSSCVFLAIVFSFFGLLLYHFVEVRVLNTIDTHHYKCRWFALLVGTIDACHCRCKVL